MDEMEQMIDLAHDATMNSERLHMWDEAEIWGATFYRLCDIFHDVYDVNIQAQYADM